MDELLDFIIIMMGVLPGKLVKKSKMNLQIKICETQSVSLIIPKTKDGYANFYQQVYRDVLDGTWV